jgi:hypothetical protein
VNTASLETLVALITVSMLFFGSTLLFFQGKTVWSFLQLLGAGCLVVVVLTHVFEAFHLFGGCIGGVRIALVIISTFGAPSLVFRYFQ